MLRSVFAALLFFTYQTDAQRLELNILGGISNYQGDLQPRIFTFQNAKPAAAFTVNYGITEKVFLRAGISLGKLEGDDAKNKDNLLFRNLNFKSSLTEFALGLEYRFFKKDFFPVTPYFFLAAGAFHFNPYTYYGNSTEKIYLKPLSTEGQGLAGYPNQKPYSLTQFCVPYGGGIKWQVNCNLNIGLEVRQAMTFTDYLDDVSSVYVDQSALLAAKGQMAVNVAWRGDEYNGTPYPADGTSRGNPKERDWYYFAGLTVGLSITDCETGRFSLGGLIKGRSGGSNIKGKRLDCPKVW